MKSLYQEQTQHADELQDIITAPPSWLLRWGISVFFSVLLLIVVLSSIIRYPDTIKTQLTINADKPPSIIKAAVSGVLKAILVRHGDVVDKGDLLGYYDSNAKPDHVVRLLEVLKEKRKDLLKNEIISNKFLDEVLTFELGELDADFQSFYLSCLKYQNSALRNSTVPTIATIEKLNFITSLDKFIRQVNDWKRKYLLFASISGKILFASQVEEEQMVAAGQALFYINPLHPSFFGEMFVSQTSVGKIKIGQRVLMKLRSYPYEEYGVLEGEIQSIDEVMYKGDTFLSRVKIHDPHGLDGVKLLDGMGADAEIITKDLSIMKRIMNGVTKLIK